LENKPSDPELIDLNSSTLLSQSLTLSCIAINHPQFPQIHFLSLSKQSRTSFQPLKPNQWPFMATPIKTISSRPFQVRTMTSTNPMTRMALAPEEKLEDEIA